MLVLQVPVVAGVAQVLPPRRGRHARKLQRRVGGERSRAVRHEPRGIRAHVAREVQPRGGAPLPRHVRAHRGRPRDGGQVGGSVAEHAGVADLVDRGHFYGGEEAEGESGGALRGIGGCLLFGFEKLAVEFLDSAVLVAVGPEVGLQYVFHVFREGQRKRERCLGCNCMKAS